MLNLPSAPQNFRGLDPHKRVKIYQCSLPHWRQDGATYFVTFRLGDALPQPQLEFLKRIRAAWELEHPHPRSEHDWEEHVRDIVRRTEAWLDEGYGECYFRERQHSQILEEAVLHFQDERYFVSCYTVIPNHCHMILRPAEGHDLETILQGMKGIVAHRVNQAIGGSGSIWQEESYDRIVRDGEHLWRSIQYIGRNARLAGLPKSAWRRWIHPEWKALGWRFVDETE